MVSAPWFGGIADTAVPAVASLRVRNVIVGAIAIRLLARASSAWWPGNSVTSLSGLETRPTAEPHHSSFGGPSVRIHRVIL
ncbi:hypothetical protein [Halorhabdus tiamatea]|uniref:Uncharacterized protein n=1 Tax=Halorhabdus tiamatea SARL4B TaxID=1033806 RepID=F7PIS3_9EURY|nr:hypothetical protein [Halorhabdus tiamatea]CCQ33358.1 hypothetical protein HTIA_1222 [Halorhabdus tiamatea SARL4B]